MIWVARGMCDFDMFVADQCQYVATSFAGGKPRMLAATGLAAGRYTLLLINFGPQEEAGRYQVVFTANASASANPPKSQGHTDGAKVVGPVHLAPAGS